MRRHSLTVSPVLCLAILLMGSLPCSGQTVEATFRVGAEPCAIAVNVFTNQVIEANCLGDTIGVISGFNNSGAAITVGSRPVALAVNFLTNKIYAANSVSNSVSVIDSKTFATATVSVGANPRSIAVNEITNQIYVANNSDDSVSIIDGATTNTTTVSAGANPIAIAVNPVTNQIYVANLGGTVTIIDGSTNQTASVPVGVFPQSLAVNPITNQIYVANSDSNTVTVINGGTQQTTTLNVGLFPVAIAVNPATNQIYVADNHSLDVVVIDGLTGTTTTVALTDNPTALAVDASSNQIYVATAGGAVNVLDGVTNQFLARVAVGANPLAVAINPVTNRLYTADFNSGTVTAVDAANNQITTIGLGGDPVAVGANPATNLIYALNANDNTMSVMDGATHQTTTVSVGTTPAALAVDTASNQIYVVNSLSNTATLVNGLTNEVTTVNVGLNPTAVSVNSVTHWAYVANTEDGTVTAINGAIGQSTTLKVGTSPSAVAVNSVTDTIYVANSGDNSVTIINRVTGQTASVNVGVKPVAIAINSVTNQIYVVNSGSNSVTVINGANNQTTSVTVGTAPVAAAVNPLTNRIYVANSGNATVTVIFGGTNQTGTVNVGSTPTALAANPVSNHIYVANAGSNTVTAIDGATNQTTTVLTGSSPAAISVNPMTGQIYVTNSASNNLSVIAEQRINTLPLATVISPLTGNETVERSPTMVLAANSSYAPVNPPVQGIRYQVDSWEGPWQAATAAGVTFNATLSRLPLGTHVMYAFADNGLAAATAGLNQNLVGSIAGYLFTVVQAQTTTEVASNLNPSPDAQSITLTASVHAVAPATGTPTGPVTFFDGAAILASGVSLDANGQASFSTSSLTPGTHSINASYAGDVNFVSSISGPLNQVVDKGQTVTTLTSNLTSSTFGQGVTLTVTVQAVAPATGVPTGTMTILDGATVLASGVGLNGSGQASFTTSSLAPGTHSLTANYSGDGNFASSISSSIGQVVVQGQTLSTLSSSLNSSAFGQGVILTVAVQAVAPAAGIPTGTVSFLDGTTVLASAVALNANGQAAFTTSSLAPGTHSLTANYSGDANFLSSASTSMNQAVVKGQTVATLLSSSTSSAFGQGVTFTVIVQPGAPAAGIPTGTVAILDGSAILASGVGLNSSGQASFSTSSLATGTHSITASYSGDGNFASSASIPVAQAVVKGQTIATLTSSQNSSAFGQAVILTVAVQAAAPAAGLPTGTVTFLDGTMILASGVALDSTGQAGFTTSSLAIGAHSFAASYGGDANFAGSNSAGVTDTVNSAQMQLTLSQTSLTVPAGSAGSFDIHISANGTLLSAITFGCTGLPANTTCLFSPSMMSPSALPGKVTVTISTDSVATALPPHIHLGGFWYGFAVVSIVFAGVQRRTDRIKSLLGVVTILWLVVICFGCGSGGAGKIASTNTSAVTPPGASVISVTATSGSSQAIATVTLTVR